MNILKLLILLLIAALFIPIPLPNTYAQWLLIQKVAATLGYTVQTQNATLRMLPSPEMRIATMQLMAKDQTLIHAEEVLLKIDFLEWLLDGNAPISEIFTHKAAIQLSALLAAISELTVIKEQPLPPIKVEHVSFDVIEERNLSLSMETNSEDNTQLKFTQNQDAFIIKTTHAGKALLLDMSATQWHLGTSDKPMFTQLSGVGRVSNNGLEFERLQATLGSGQIHGVLRFTRAQTWNTAGSLTLEQIPINALLAWIDLPILEGDTTGTIFLDSTGNNAAELITTAAISGELTVNAGKLYGIDLITPARTATLKDFHGGETAFNHLQLELERQREGEWLITINQLRSDDINGHGLIRINEGMLLDGVAEMSLQQKNANKISLLITGSISSALVRTILTPPLSY